MVLNRAIKERILFKLQPNKVIVLSGARRTGKTVLLREIIKDFNEPYLFLNGEDLATHELLARRSLNNYRAILDNKSALIIDEAQKIDDIGIKLKLIVDEIEGIKVIVTGSSVFELSNSFSEPLTGRKYDFQLFPFAELELAQIENRFEAIENLRDRLIFGNYPELTMMKIREEKKDYLNNLLSSYLFKDIVSFDNVKASAKIMELLKLIAYQVGSEVSLNELGRQLGMNKLTVEKYLDLLSKIFVIFRIGAFSGNLRKEVVRSSKWYFYDNGIRNAIISNFNSIDNRNDIGKLWENYLISERIKYQNIRPLYSSNYFWRTYDKQEIDWIESRDGKLFAYEFKWKNDKARIPAGWKKRYPDSEFDIITNDNYFNWLK